MALNQEIRIRQQVSRLTVTVNAAIRNCKDAIASDSTAVFTPRLLEVKQEVIALLRQIQELENVTAELVNGCDEQ
ncbi:hypothetical protein H6F43_06975 [Leptolyngbya sp. FACHB-36]|uniref:hypothetical protein n=1 Tax=Leptolyngbya sp. FACHB-36 TaxID=2692808 RepID=UPI0016811F9A|nr:hypothetical protein [Leptolyngbya sp. FACHB-36]MBD2019929.1 hypothetical protein [Leptolyngbya sp. FACHB-36]